MKIIDQIIKTINENKLKYLTLSNVNENLGAFLITKLLQQIETQTKNQKFHNAFLIITKTQDVAEKVAYQLEKLLRNFLNIKYQVCLFSSLEWSPYEFLSPSKNLLVDRVITLKKIIDYKKDEKIFVVAPITAIMQKCAPIFKLKDAGFKIKKGDTINVEQFINDLISMGYYFEDPVTDICQFANRGYILDVFTPNFSSPIRLELFGDTIDEIKLFNIEDQRTLNKIDEAYILPATEYILNNDEINKLIDSIQKIAPLPSNHELLDIKNNLQVPNIEKYIPHLFNNLQSILDYLNEYIKDYCVMYYFLSDIISEAQNYYLKLEKDYNENKNKDPYLLPPNYYCNFYENLLQSINSNELIFKIELTHYDVSSLNNEVININSNPAPKFSGKFNKFVTYVKELVESLNIVIIILPSIGQVNRVANVLSQMKLPVIVNENIITSTLAKNTIYINEGYLHEGFIIKSESLFVFSNFEIFNEHQPLYDKQVQLNVKESAKRRYSKISSHLELNEGDYVVHVNYGIGIYRGVTLLSTCGIESDYLLVEYLNNDKLYVPIDSISLLYKYTTLDGYEPKINSLSDGNWKRQKTLARKSIQKLASHLITLYAKRNLSKGFKFSEDNELMQQFEEAFPYNETYDQQNAILEVKCDMESEKPMDRLICGDVGFGKTEVAIRAAFKACLDGKQVAFLTPTTILAMQHYNTLISRMAAYPIEIEFISRFKSKSEQNEILKRLKEGKIDIIVGTHRLIQKDVQFKDLGLLIIDEEQRFGVKHKERLKEFKENVDVLSLSATPIPRTLHMSLMGLRDISIINTPPADRLPVKIFILHQSDEVIKDAISHELMRNGQVYYLHNQVQTIESVTEKLRKLVPEAKIKYAHGQMKEEELEKIMVEFYEQKFNVLVTTTIIENGIDIPNVNTIIIERADTFGLSQLYQLKGRVGRSKIQAYAYFLIPHESVLTSIAKKRLQAIKEFSELGSGYKIAMRDLEIRGAGNLLGYEQHGHIHNIGFDLYCKLLDEEIKKLQGITVYQEVEKDCEIDIKINAYIPSDYISSTFVKIDIYKRMVSLSNFDEVLDLSNELIDRFGQYPEQVYNLLQIIKIKILGRKLQATSITEEQKHIIVKILNKGQISPKAIENVYKKFSKIISFNNDNEYTILYILKNNLKGDNLLQTIISILSILTQT